MYITEITDGPLKAEFINFPKSLYKNIPFWVPPLDIDLKERLSVKSNPFLKYGKIKLFAAYDDQECMIGRIAGIINPVHNDLYKDTTGFFGLFECINDKKTAEALFDKVKEYLCENGLTSVIGPVNFTTNDECGILFMNFNESPMMMCNYSPSYYDKLFKDCGFEKAIDLFSYEGYTGHIYPEKYHKVFNRITSNPLVTFRTFNKNKLQEDTLIIKNLYNECFSKVWGFVPLSEEEVMVMAKTFIKFYDKELIWIAYYKDKPAGFILGLPDINQVLKNLNGSLFPFGIFKLYFSKNKINALRVLTLGVLEEYRHLGIEIFLINKIHSRMKTAGYIRGELSVVMENNLNMRRVLENLGFQLTKKYRLYKAGIS